MMKKIVNVMFAVASILLVCNGWTYEVSQSFETPGQGLGFVTNIDDSVNNLSRYIEFPTTYDAGTSRPLFIGNAAMYDYIAIYPMHSNASITSPTLFNDGDGTLASVTNIDGANFVVAEDSRMNRYASSLDPNADDFLLMAFEELHITGATEVQVTIAAAAPRYGQRTYANMPIEASPFNPPQHDVTDLSVWVSVDGGTPEVIGQFRGDEAEDFTTEMALDADFDEVGEGTTLTKAFQDFTFTKAVSGDSLQVLVRLCSRQNDEEIAFDNVRVNVIGAVFPNAATNWEMFR
ncbi:MAG TPA: hypothetical protein PLD73_14825 [Candidatus Hydrogenedentes bacterium]|nr:hypothetical protein [Candidatus Hydrogenedentota bacterium]